MSESLPSKDQIISKRWRLENLYKIMDKEGHETLFKLNWAQEKLFNDLWYTNVILKARQLGVTTFWALYFLDDCFWYGGISAGIIANKKESAEDIFKNKVKYAYDRMPEWCYAINKATNDRVGELVFKNGSSYKVSTGFRSGTKQRLLISEFGGICCHSPDVAKEIVTGSLSTVAAGQISVIESTAEGREGYFYNFCEEAESLKGKDLSKSQMKFFFFPWFLEPTYRDSTLSVKITPETNSYIDKIEIECQVEIDEEQRRWYEIKKKLLNQDIKSEYPSNPKEAFESANEGLWYGQQMVAARKDDRICKLPYDEAALVHTAWDIGLDDMTSIWFFQVLLSGSIHIINYYENRDEAASHYCEYISNQKYKYGYHLLPHDAAARDKITLNSYEKSIQPLLSGQTKIIPIADCDIMAGIQKVRSILSRCYFDATKCESGIKHLESYKKEWDDKIGGYKSRPAHDKSSHGADAFRMMSVGIDKLMDKGSMKDDYNAVRRFWGG